MEAARRQPPPAPRRERRWSILSFEVFLALTQFLGFVSVVLSGFYFGTTHGGLRWKKEGADYENVKYPGMDNYHGLFMVLGFIFFQGEALLSYRLYRHEVKLLSKFIHVIFHILALASSSFALAAVIKAKDLQANKHFYSIHSWIGLAIMFTYFVQFVFGLITYALPFATRDMRVYFMPIHRAVGSGLFGASIVQVVLGFGQHGIFFAPERASDEEYCFYKLNCSSHLEFIFNFTVASIVLYGLSVLTVIFTEDWRRQPTLDEQKPNTD